MSSQSMKAVATFERQTGLLVVFQEQFSSVRKQRKGSTRVREGAGSGFRRGDNEDFFVTIVDGTRQTLQGHKASKRSWHAPLRPTSAVADTGTEALMWTRPDGLPRSPEQSMRRSLDGDPHRSTSEKREVPPWILSSPTGPRKARVDSCAGPNCVIVPASLNGLIHCRAHCFSAVFGPYHPTVPEFIHDVLRLFYYSFNNFWRKLIQNAYRR